MSVALGPVPLCTPLRNFRCAFGGLILPAYARPPTLNPQSQHKEACLSSPTLSALLLIIKWASLVIAARVLLNPPIGRSHWADALSNLSSVTAGAAKIKYDVSSFGFKGGPTGGLKNGEWGVRAEFCAWSQIHPRRSYYIFVMSPLSKKERRTLWEGENQSQYFSIKWDVSK